MFSSSCHNQMSWCYHNDFSDFPKNGLGNFQHKGLVGLNHTASRKKELISIVTHQLSSQKMHFGLCSQMNCALVVIKIGAFELLMRFTHTSIKGFSAACFSYQSCQILL